MRKDNLAHNRGVESSQQSHWSRTQEAGTLVGMRFLYLIYRIFGRGVFSLLMFPVSFYFVLFRPEQRRASLQFLSAHYHKNLGFWRIRPNVFHVLLHFRSFADVILEKLLGWVINIEERDFYLSDPIAVERLLSDTRGQLIIGSHFGNLEFCRSFIQRQKGKTINILVFEKHAGNFVRMMQKNHPDSRVNVFQVDELDISSILTLKEKINAGEWVFIAGDRIPLSGLKSTVSVEFYGRQAPFPIGPYMFAKALACPVSYMFAYRSPARENKIVFDVVTVSERLTVSNRSAIDDLRFFAQLYATKLEEHSAQAPYQWFNFYDFWSDPAETFDMASARCN